MLIEDESEARKAIEKYYLDRGMQLPTIARVQVIHSDPIVSTVRYQELGKETIIRTLKWIGDSAQLLT